MSALNTPRKRKAAGSTTDVLATPRSTPANRLGRGPPTPNPPLAPFPTPPRSRTRQKADLSEHDFEFESASSLGEGSSNLVSKATALPHHLQTLLLLHQAFNLALSLAIATRPPVLPPHSSSTTKIELKDITNFAAIKETVERSSGRRFGVQELARLAWLWTWDGKALPGEDGAEGKGKAKEEENPFIVNPATAPPEKVCGLTYLITTTRALDASRKKVYTHGIGIELDLKPGETRQILLGGGEGGLSNRGQGGGVGAIGRWSTQGDLREAVMRSRLERWVELNGGYEPPLKHDYPTPSTSESSRSTIPPIPFLPLPKLPSSSLLSSTNIFSALASSSSSVTTSPGLSTPPKKIPTTSGLSDPFEIKEKDKKVVRPGSVEERRLAMQERIKARNAPKDTTTTLGSAISQGKARLSAAKQQEELKRRSTLSRLENVAEAVWMLFSAPSPGPSTLPTPPSGRRKAIPMSEAADVIVKSSKTPISLAEAQTSLTMLTDLCPFFLKIKVVGKQEWLEMPPSVALPSSPSARARPSLVQSSNDSATWSPGPGSGGEPFISIAKPPSSPTSSPSRLSSSRLNLSAPTSPSPRSTINKKALEEGLVFGGAASPGKVRRTGGLREVRERIRRELGE